MALSIAFSVTLYHISDSELNRGLRRPGEPVFRETSLYNFDAFRETRLSEGRQNLKANLILLNVITFGAGFAASYLLARKTLEPIAEAMESQMRFTADASHELRTPLTAMQTEIEVALRDKNLTKEDARELLESNLEEVEKLRLLSDGLLRLAQNNGQKLTHNTALVGESIELAVKHVSKIADAKNISISYDADSDIKAKGDMGAIAEVIAILLDNAIKYSDSKTVILVSALAENNHVELRVKDQGMGIVKDDIEHIFDRFYRADTSRTKQDVGGYGLGLSIAKKIVDLHDGSIRVEKTSKKGTTFLVSLHQA
jgi:signal transduction histidine kinase